MLYLKPSEAESLLRDPDPEFAFRYASGLVEEILRLTRCQPYLLQLLGSALVTQANLQGTQEITSEHLEVAIQDAFTLGEPYFVNVWTEFTGTNLLEVAAGQELLLSLSQNSLFTPDPTDPIVQTALRRLQRHHVIEKSEGNYCIEIPLFKQWVQERAIRTYNQLS